MSASPSHLKVVVDNTKSAPAPLTPSDEQAKAIAELIAHRDSEDINEPFHVLEGPAGCGKTFSSTRVVEGYKGNVAYCAPTNKAVRVISDALIAAGIKDPRCCTIHSLLGLRMEPDGEIKKIGRSDNAPDLGDLTMVMVDEAFMLGDEMFNGHIAEAYQRHPHIRWILSGDPFQLPPVNEDHSPVEDVQKKSILSEIRRQDNQILVFSKHLREIIQDPSRPLELYSDHDDEEGVWKLKDGSLQRAMFHYLDGFKDGSHRAIAWRNAQVDYLNSIVRDEMWGEKKARTRWVEGDRITLRDPAKDFLNDGMLAHTGDDGTVECADIAPHPLWKEITCYRIVVRMDNVGANAGKTITLWELHERSKNRYEIKLAELAESARADKSAFRSNKEKWRPFWQFKESFHSVRHGFALTTHGAQGSTFTRTFVNYRDIMKNSNTEEALRCLYTASTRPRLGLYLG